MTRLAKIVSYVFHPLLLTTWLVLVLTLFIPATLVTRLENQLAFIGFVFGITFLLPVLNLFLFRQYHMISSLEMPERNERLLPFTFISIVYLLVAVLFWYRVHLSVNFTRLIVIISALVVAGTMVTFFVRVSMHALGMGGLIAILFSLNQLTGGLLFWPFLASILLAGLVGTARLQLNAHTPGEVALGALVGFAVGYALMGYLF